MTTYEGVFGKIGRGSFVPPKIEQFEAKDTDELAVKIDRCAGKFLASKDREVDLYSNGTGTIYAGGRQVGMFTWKVKA